jgi:hypothetical protein
MAYASVLHLWIFVSQFCGWQLTQIKFALYQVRVRIGSPITGYGQESRNRAARQRIPNKIWTDEDGVEHVEVISCQHDNLSLLFISNFH